jgi:hypothetical protein
MTKDYVKKYLDLSTLIPERLKNKTNTSIMRNLFNRFLTKEETLPLFGFSGKKIVNPDDIRPYIVYSSVDKKINSLIPTIYAKVGAEEFAFTFRDILNKAKILGINTDKFDRWGSAQTFNFCPPINLDKFANFYEYYWVAKALPTPPSIPWNPNNDPEYYVIQPGAANDWSIHNYWVHKDDLPSYPGGLDLSKVIRANIPIIEYDNDLELNNAYDVNGDPTYPGNGISYTQSKTQFNQLPLFNLYRLDGTFSGFVSSIFYYKEDTSAEINQFLQRRIVRDINADFIFCQGLLENGSDSRILFYKKSGNLKSIWVPGPSSAVSTTPIYTCFGNGTIVGLTSVSNAPSEFWTLVAKSPTVFSISGTKSGVQPDVYVNVPYSNGIISFTLSSGSTPFIVGDKITFRVINREIPRYVYEDNDGNVINFPGGAAADVNKVGTWINPNQLKFNPLNENRLEIGQGDLTNHFRSIIGAQLNFNGSNSGPNNYRNIPHNHGLGGNIKYFNNVFNLFISLMLQNGLSPLSILSFAESSYLQAINSLYEYINQNLFKYITEKGNPTPPLLDPNSAPILSLFQDYVDSIKNRSDLKSVFFDSTSPITNWCPTLPQLGLLNGVVPKITFDNELGIYVLIHHDGHRSPIYQRDIEFDRKLTRLSVKRSDGNEVPGVFSPTVPSFPSYKNQLWFNSTNGELRLFAVKSDTTAAPPGIPSIGDFWFDTVNLRRWNGSAWIIHTNVIDAWKIVDTQLIVNNLLLTVETILYNGIPKDIPLKIDVDNTIITSAPEYIPNQEYELAVYAAKYKYDMYAPDYISTNPFTWNYKFTNPSVISPTKSLLNSDPSINARWFDIYKRHFSLIPGSLETCRPNLEPWKLVGQNTKPIDWDTGAISIGGPGTQFASTVSLPNISPLQPVNYVSTSNVNLLALPNVIDNNLLSINDRVLLVGQVNPKENGIYTVVYPGTGSNGIWTRSTDMQTGTIPPIETNVAVSSGYEWKNTVWVLTTTGLVGTDVLIFEQYRLWSENMWTWIKSQIGTYALCVNVHTDELLPPYVSPTEFTSNESILTTLPPSTDAPYSFGDNGPVEIVWKKSLEYAYGKHRTNFKISPITYLNLTWRNPHIVINNLALNRQIGKRISHKNFTLHGEEIKSPSERNILTNVSGLITSIANNIVELKCVSLLSTGSIFEIFINNQSTNEFIECNGPAYSNVIGNITFNNFSIKDLGIGFEIDDIIKIELTPLTANYSFKPASIYKIYGLAQYYTQLLRYNSTDVNNTYNAVMFRGWDVKLGNRMDGLIRTDNIIIKSDKYTFPETSFNVLLKINKNTRDTWLNAIRIQLVQIGYNKMESDGTIVPVDEEITDTSHPNYNKDHGKDWVFRIEHYNSKHPIIKYYNLDTNGPYQTFNALDKEHTKAEWKIYQNSLDVVEQTVPFTITGIQNVVNFLYGYVKLLEEDGWRFNNSDKPEIDEVTGRTINWQLEIEKFIDAVYSGMLVGQGHILNPFINKVWFETPTGIVSSLRQNKFSDILVDPLIFDILGNIISINDISITREDDITEIISKIPIFSLHITVDEYEHIILFDNYIDKAYRKGLIFDPFIGAHISRILLSGQKQIIRSMRPSFGGYVLNGNKTIKNLETHVSEFGQYYDAEKVTNNDISAKFALSLLGYNKKKYFDLLDVSDKSQFNFWRGLIQAKGTNTALDAFLNSKKFEQAFIDEYWAYKIAEYGDARTVTYPELKIHPSDTQLNVTGFQFESQDPQYNIDSELIPGFKFIAKNDENRWMTLDDLDKHQYFIAEKTEEFNINIISADTIFELPFFSEMQFEIPAINYSGFGNGEIELRPVQIRKSIDYNNELPEIWTITATSATTFNITAQIGISPPIIVGNFNIDEYYSPTNYEHIIIKISKGTVPFNSGDQFTFSIGLYKIFNKIIKAKIVGNYKIIGMNPAKPKFNPIKLIDYKEKTVITDIGIWHPLMDAHETSALECINIKGNVDPAKYNYSTKIVGNPNYNPYHSWGNREVGKIWWDTSNLDYIPYSDFSNVDQKHARWGNLANYASIDVYEWIKSDIPPNEYDALAKIQELDANIDPLVKASGKAAKKEYYYRDRIWKARPIAWSYSENPSAPPPVFVSSFFSKLYITSGVIGNTTLVLETGQFSDYGVEPGMLLSAWELTDKIPDGEIIVGSDIDYMLGSDTSISSPIIVPHTAFDFISINKSPTSEIKSDCLGKIVLSNEVDGGIYYVRMTAIASGLTQRIQVNNITSPIGTVIFLDFDLFGLQLSAETAIAPVINASVVASALGNTAHNIYVRQTITGEVTIDMPTGITEFSNDPNDLLQYGWVSWRDPSSDELSADLLAPNNSWNPIFGNYKTITQITSTFIDRVKSYQSNKFILNNGTEIEKYNYEWSNWVSLENEKVKIITGGTVPTLTFSEPIDINRLSIYINGILQPRSVYNISGNTVTVLNLPGEGHTVIGIHKHYIPSDSELSFNPDIIDNPSIQRQYKVDYQYVVIPERDLNGNIIGNKYYYWVTDKTTNAQGKKLSVQQIIKLLKYGPSEFITFQKMLPEKLLGSDLLPTRYNAISIVNIGRFIKKENSYKLRFTKDFALRDDPNDLDLKNKHVEWMLIRPGQKYKIPRILWDKIVDSACGEDKSGNTLPSLFRKEYDERHSTFTRYGFGKDQIFAEKSLVIKSLMNTILNTKLLKDNGLGEKIPDTLEDVIDFNDKDNWFSSPSNTRITMEKIWQKGKPEQINELFFAVLEDALANNYEMTDIFKTSRLSAYSIRVMKQILPSEYDEY